MRVVLDANVFVSAAINDGPPHRIVQRWLEHGDFEVVMCPELLAEITVVLTERPRLRRWIDLDAADRYVDVIRTMVDLLPDPAGIVAATRDLRDDYLVALARENQADLIVTGDKDLLEWHEQQPPVVPPTSFVGILQERLDRELGLSP